MSFNAVELCAGGGGQALGLEMAGFHHVAAVEYEPHYCTTLRTNRPHWKVVEDDIDMIYHFALPELIESVHEIDSPD
jgi:DNA (cytosine-5)-methyltransferase 1